ncbi:MAG: SDR family oxidoreductase [Chloroflexota bacterium]
MSGETPAKGLFDLTGLVALVTGAASGLGRAIARGAAAHGARVVLADLDRAGCEETAGLIGSAALAVVGVDVVDYEQCERMAADAARESGRVDMSFNVPGINVRKPALEMTPAEFRRVLDVNLVGVFHCARAVGRLMVEQRGGRMVNIASIHGHGGLEGQAAYASAKHGVVGLTKVLALEWAPFGVRVNALAPGYVHTSLTAPVRADGARYGELTGRIPMHRFAEPEEMVGPALFLVSDASSYMTGASLIVDGGWTAT